MEPQSLHDSCDVAIVGGGPIGIESAVALMAAGFDARVVEAGPLGNTIAWWAPQTRWFSSNDRIAIAGVPLQTPDQSKASREEYLTYLRSVVEQFSVPVDTYTRVASIHPLACAGGEEVNHHHRWQLALVPHRPNPREGLSPQISTRFQDDHEAINSARSLNAAAVVLATGGTDYPNRLNVPGEELPHVDGYLRECHQYQGRQVLIVGGRNSAVEAAIRLHRVGAKVTLCYHGPHLPETSIKYWLRPEIEGLIRSGSVQAFFDSRIREIHPKHVVLKQNQDHSGQEPSTTLNVPADDVLTLIGYRQNPTLFEQLGIPIAKDSGVPEYDETNMETCLPGVYIAGTAIGGTQSSRYQVFLENCHEHPRRIADHLKEHFRATLRDQVTGEASQQDAALRSRIDWQPES